MNNDRRQMNASNSSQSKSGKGSRSRGKRTKNVPKSDPHMVPRILTLPSEILSYIFEMGTLHANPSDDDGNDDDDDDDSSPFPHFAVLCSHVCRHFRQVALSTPQLWTYVDFREGYPYETAHAFLLRSKDTPLTLDIDLTTGSGTQNDHDAIQDMEKESETIYAMIARHVHRWKEFELKADHYEIVQYWLLRLSTHESAPRLENLGIFCHEDWKDPEYFHPTELRNAVSIFTGGAPRIKSVELWGVHLDWNNIPFLRGLTTLQLAWHARDVGLTAIQFVEVLKQCPNLHDLSLQQSGPVKGAWPKECITLKHLEVLELAYLDLDTAIEILDHVQFSGLKKLSLDLEQDNVAPFIKSLLTHRNRFGSVRYLKLRSFNCSYSKAKLFLQAFPSLSSLNLNFNYLLNSFYVALTKPRPPFCPKLDTLKLSGLDYPNLRKVIECRSPFRIGTLYLDQTDGPWDTLKVDRLKRFVKNVHFYTCSDDEEATSEGGDDDEDSGYISEDYYSSHLYTINHTYGDVPHTSALYYDAHYEIYGDNAHMYDSD